MFKDLIKGFFLLGLISLIITACADQKENAEKEPPKIPEPKAFYFDCDSTFGFAVHMNDEGSTAKIYIGKKALKMKRVESASGEKFSDGKNTFWLKGNEALLEFEDSTYTGCTENIKKTVLEKAKVRGVDYRAVGQEPGWTLEIMTDGTMILTTNYGENVYHFKTPRYEMKLKEKSLVYNAENDKHKIEVRIINERCSDSMSGNTYYNKVEVVLDDKRLKGCGGRL